MLSPAPHPERERLLWSQNGHVRSVTGCQRLCSRPVRGPWLALPTVTQSSGLGQVSKKRNVLQRVKKFIFVRCLCDRDLAGGRWHSPGPVQHIEHTI